MIIQVGSYPPPIGGISIYIKRMKDFLDTKEIENQVWDYSRIRKTENNVINVKFPLIPFHIALKKDYNLIHYNICGLLTKVYIGFFNNILFKNRKKVITLHGNCTDLSIKKTKLLIKVLNNFDSVICVKHIDKEYLLNHGLSSNVYDIPVFIPPVVQKKEFEEISEKGKNFIESHKPIISANASNIVLNNDIDLYGIDMCIDLCTNLKKDYPEIGFVFCLSAVKNFNYFEKMKQRIIKNDIESNFLFLTESCQLYPIIMKSDVFVRPTNTDGDAVSVREALYFKIPTVASDVVPRPEGTTLFKNRDNDDFTLKIKDIFNNYNWYKKKLTTIKIEDNSEKVLKVYQNLTKLNS